MALALNQELNKPLRSLISVDMSPAKGKISQEWVIEVYVADLRFAEYTKAMIDVEDAKVKTKAEADKILQKVEPVSRSFQPLLTLDLIYETVLIDKYEINRRARFSSHIQNPIASTLRRNPFHR